jgi:hypothetical protein
MSVAQQCAKYMRNGGRVVFAANFTNYMPQNEYIRHFFRTFGCFWHFSELRKAVTIQQVWHAP